MNVHQFKVLGLVVFGALSAATASAQVRCTMPNGRVIEQQLATVCPQGTVKAETLDGLPARIVSTLPPPPTPPAPPSTRPQLARQSANTLTPGPSLVTPTCPATDPSLLRLPASHQAQAKAFAAKAQRLSASGRCVIEGSWGVNYQRYYFAVYDVGTTPSRAYHVRYTAEELGK